MRALLVASLLFACACSSSTPVVEAGVESCHVALSGNVTDSADPATCATFATAADAGDPNSWQLGIDVSTSMVARLSVTITLGDSPTASDYASDAVMDWNAVALTGTNCAFEGGPTSVPPGSFSLALTSVDEAHGVAHGTLTLDLYVHAPPTVDCGAGQEEYVSISF